jgi:hypothetical protein
MKRRRNDPALKMKMKATNDHVDQPMTTHPRKTKIDPSLFL